MRLPSKYVLPVFFLVLFVGAMILGPLLYWGLGLVWSIPFHRAMDRALLISAVAALGLFWSRIHFRELWPWNRTEGLRLLLGYVIAAVSAQAIIGFGYALCGFTDAHLSAHEAQGRIIMAVVAALLIPPLEETVFRGFIQGELVRSLGRSWGLVLAALIFMLAHFIKVDPAEFDHQPVHLWSGVTAVMAAFHPVAQGDFLSGKGINLFLLGLVLGGFYLRSGSLWLSAGLHSGLILMLLLFSGFMHPMEPPRVAYFGGDILSNPVTTLVLVLLALWLWRFYRHPSDSPEPAHGIGSNAPST